MFLSNYEERRLLGSRISAVLQISVSIQYQVDTGTASPVLDGAGLDIDFHISSPSGQILYSDHHKSDGMHTTVSEKLIFFELILDNMDADEEPDDWKEYVHGTDMLDMKLEDIMDTINSVKARLGKSIQIQTVLRAFEARDRNLQESSYNRVNFWSVVNVVVMMLVSGVQVYLVRSLFEDQRKIRT
ncbi:transmembrane emp24 domain-containing protein 5 isoform X4 [Dunckerocampus dactyliophorus]|uniref:transmembrane emp24 domain-containing protein 5 isoform X4 n=1 Tax=Dunckerocampus dactyliophorus TaxID=161453 RepID=UPI00240503D8|nr:transmembrane emp24 domain-containing protein 5 isoform X4 [Dunckerocampus dactyliophorus]